MIRCAICNNEMSFAFTSTVLCKYDAIFDFCRDCGFLQARNPFWLSESYASAVASTDTGLIFRNNWIARKLLTILFVLMGERGSGRYVDIAGGYGMLTRLMRDSGLDFYWEDKYCVNVMARGFEYFPGLGAFNAVTAFEVMEHIEDPLTFIREAMEQTKANSFICTTDLFKGPPPETDKWWYYSFETGQHISFFQRRTLEKIASNLGLKFASAGGIHIFSKFQINEIMLRLSVSRLSYVISLLVPKIIGTRIISDHNTLVQQLHDTQSFIKTDIT